jgi:anti-sigma factor RsiW
MIRLWRRRSHDHDPLVCREFVVLVTDYLEGRLSDADHARFEAHLAECDGCEGYLEDIRLIADTLRSTLEPPDSATREALVNAFRDLRGRSSP